jgi:ketosteroid isomerase-like protein
MSEQENLRILQDGYEAFQRGDIPAVLSLMAESVEWESPGGDAIPYAGLHRGRAGVAEFFRLLSEADEVQQFEPRRMLAQGELVVALGHYRARVRSTGRVVECDWVQVFTFRDGLITKFQEFYDTAAVVEAYQAAAAV